MSSTGSTKSKSRQRRNTCNASLMDDVNVKANTEFPAAEGERITSSDSTGGGFARRRRSSNSLGSSLASLRKRTSKKNSKSNIDDAMGQLQRQQLLDTIDRLSCHLPQTVLDQLVQQVVNEENEEQVLSLLGKSILIKPQDNKPNKKTSPTRKSISSQLEELRLYSAFKPRRSRSLTQLQLDLPDNPNPNKKDMAKILTSNPIGMNLPMDDSFSAQSGSDTSSIADDASWFLTSTFTDGDYGDADHDDGDDSVSNQGSIGTMGTSNVRLDGETNHEEEQGVSKLCQGRLSVAGHSSLAGIDEPVLSSSDSSHHEANTNADTVNTVNAEGPSVAHTHANRTRLESTRYQSAILFVDISGFTKLSRTLEVESLSKVINSYFQKIVDIIRSYGGDVLKFAGDALLVEWKLLPDTSHTSYKHPAFRAAVCAAKLVDECSDFDVAIPNSQDKASLNIHCALAFGNVVGTHVGDRNRMEYVILGDALRQIANAMKEAKLGQVVASPESLDALDWIVHFVSSIKDRQNAKPKVIARKSQLLFKPVDPNALRKVTIEFDDEELSSKCQGWTTSMLTRLKKRMTPYAHPAVLQNLRSLTSSSQSTTSIQQRASKGLSMTAMSLNRTQSAMTAEEAELRDVVTVFLQPKLPDNVNVMDPDYVSDRTLDILQQIMVIVQTETQHYQGQLRQFIVDDKGLVVIVNWGLRGSTYPNMVTERIMPCVRKLQTLLFTELGIESRTGATSGKLYCGVVGAKVRHEYAVLGPSCNLAARLMGNIDNRGILFDQSLIRKAGKAGHHPFRARKPIIAKGYDRPVRIYEPAKKSKTFKKDWLDVGQDLFVGRQEELRRIVSLASGILADSTESEKKAGCLKSPKSKFVFVDGSYGVGKSFLLSKATRQIEVVARSCRHITRHVFSEDDSFKPFSIVRPLFLDILRRRSDNSSNKSVVSERIPKASQAEQRKQEEAQLYLVFLQTSLQAGIPMQYVEMFAGMIFTETLSDGDIGKWSDKQQKMSEWIRIAQQLVKVYLEMTKSFDLIVLALDDISCMDEMSWRLVKRLYEQTSKFLILGSARSEHGLNIQAGFWEGMKGNGQSAQETQNFIHMKLNPMDEEEITTLTRSRLGTENEGDTDAIYRTIYFLSEGNPLLACEIADIFSFSSEVENTQESSNVTEDVSEILLNRLDSLPSSVRLHVQCGAILGHSFNLSDLVSVMEKYNGLATAEEKAAHELEVRQSLEEAQLTGFLFVSKVGDTSLVVYTFSHVLLREVISQHILQEFKDKITRLTDAISKSSDVFTYQELRHHLKNARAKALPVRT